MKKRSLVLAKSELKKLNDYNKYVSFEKQYITINSLYLMCITQC
jgi:hypothetical protein